MDEREFLEAYDVAAFDRPSVTVDVVLLAISTQGNLQTLLVRRADHPYRGSWSLPGGFVAMNESLDAAARRVMNYKTGVKNVFLEQLYTFGDPKRDPRTRVITVAYYALVPASKMERALKTARTANLPAALATLGVAWDGEEGGSIEATDAAGARMRLAFDHAAVIGAAIKRIRGKLHYAPIGFNLLPPAFTLLQLQQIHEAVLGRKLNKDSFRRTMLASDLLDPTGQTQSDVGHRPAALYRFHKGEQDHG